MPLIPPLMPAIAAYSMRSGPLAGQALPLVGLCMVGGGLGLMGTTLDRNICLELNQMLSGWPQFWALLSVSALGISGLLLVAACSASDPRRLAAFLLALVVGGLVVHGLKLALQADRPLAYFTDAHAGFTVVGEALRRNAMPSGHSATAFAVASLLLSGHGLPRRWWVVPVLLLAALQALSRIAVGAHWPSDVLVGSGLGLCVAPLVWGSPLTERAGRWFGRPGVRRGVAVALPALGVGMAWGPLGWPLPVWAQVVVVVMGLAAAQRWWVSAAAASVRPARLA